MYGRASDVVGTIVAVTRARCRAIWYFGVRAPHQRPPPGTSSSRELRPGFIGWTEPGRRVPDTYTVRACRLTWRGVRRDGSASS